MIDRQIGIYTYIWYIEEIWLMTEDRYIHGKIDDIYIRDRMEVDT